MDGVTQERHLKLQGVAVLLAEPADDLAHDGEHFPRSDEMRGSHLGGAVGHRGAEVSDGSQDMSDGEGLEQLAIVLDGRQHVEQVVLKLGQILQHMTRAGVKEVDDPDVVVAVDEDVGRVEVTVNVGDEVVVRRGQRWISEEVLVEPGTRSATPDHRGTRARPGRSPE